MTKKNNHETIPEHIMGIKNNLIKGFYFVFYNWFNRWNTKFNICSCFKINIIRNNINNNWYCIY